MFPFHRSITVAAALLAGSLALTGCGASSGAGAGSSSSASPSSSPSSGPAASPGAGPSSGAGASSGPAATATAGSSTGGTGATQDVLKTAYQGEIGTPPTTATTPKKGVDLWVISCGEQVPSCATPSAAVKVAAEAAGWKATVCDGKLSNDATAGCIRQATSAGAQVIVPVGTDCATYQQPFQEAKTAKVMVVGGGGADCDETGATALWASERIELEKYPTAKKFHALEGKLAADWLIGKTDGKAQVLQLEFTDTAWGPWQAAGFKDEIATCSGCKIVSTLQVSGQDVGSGALPQKFSTALLKSPDADSVFIPIGGFMAAGLAQAVVSSGRSDTLNVVAAIGDAANMELIRSNGGQDAAVGYPTPWGAWGSVDTAIRVLNGEKALPQGDGMQVVDKDTNLPAAGQDYTGGVDYRAAYQKAWGLA